MARKKKFVLGLDDGFMAELNSLDAAAKKAKIARLEVEKQDAKEWLKTNDAVLSLKESLAQIEGPVKDCVKACRNRQQFIIKQLKEAGEYQTGK